MMKKEEKKGNSSRKEGTKEGTREKKRRVRVECSKEDIKMSLFVKSGLREGETTVVGL